MLYFCHMKCKMIAFLLVLMITFDGMSQVSARVMQVKDGDTYVLKVNESLKTVRLLNVDAPELNQSWGLQAQAKVRDLILGKYVSYEYVKTDLYDRELGRIKIGKRSLDSLLIRNGWAWHYINYDRSKKLDQLMKRASDRKLGLWECGKENVCPPWHFREYNAKYRFRYCRGCNAL